MPKIYGVYFAYSQAEVGMRDDSKPYYPEELARVGKYKDHTSQLEAYTNTPCPASQLFEASSEQEFDQKVEEYKKNFQNEKWLEENINPYI